MLETQSAMHEEDYRRLMLVCNRLSGETQASLVFIVDKNGQLIAETGNVGTVDTISMATLAAGNIAATGGLAKLLGEREFSILFHEGEKDNLHLSIIASRYILVVVFQKKASLGLVRLRVKKASQELETVFYDMNKRNSSGEANTLFAEITDEDIDNLFND